MTFPDRSALNGCSKLSRLSLCVLLFIIGGCVQTVDTGEQRGRTLRHFGFTTLSIPDTDEKAYAYRISTLGAGLARNKAFLGWNSRDEIIADPEKCQIIVILRTEKQIEYNSEIVAAFKGENICVTDFSGL